MVPKHTTIPNTREKKTRQSFVHIPEIIGATLKNHVAPWSYLRQNLNFKFCRRQLLGSYLQQNLCVRAPPWCPNDTNRLQRKGHRRGALVILVGFSVKAPPWCPLCRFQPGQLRYTKSRASFEVFVLFVFSEHQRHLRNTLQPQNHHYQGR